MRKAHLFLILTTFAVLAASCAKEPVFEQDNRIPLNIDGSIDQVATKATAQGFVDKDAVGLFAVNYTEGNTVAGILAASGNQADNVKYVFDESAHTWTPVKAVYYKDINTNVDLYLYYPYQSSITDVEASTFEVQKDQSAAATATTLSGYEASDWLWGKVENVTPQESKVRIPLSHRLSAVQVTLVKGTGFGEGEFDSIGKSVILTNTTRKAKLDFTNGSVTPVGGPQLDGIVMCPQEDGTFRAIVIPQSLIAETQLFAITLDGLSYSFKQDATVNYLAGKQLNVSITVNKKTPSGEYELSLGNVSIADWKEDLNTHGGEARQYYVVNVETPGTLGEVIAAAGKNPAKIRNLKITGQVNHEDFYFMRDNMDILEAVNMKESRVVHCFVGSGWHENENGEWVEWEEYIDDIIPESAFMSKKSLVYFVFPEVITEIRTYAFHSTTLSGPLILPDGVKSIGPYAFQHTNITNIQFPQGLERIEQGVFYGCKALSGDLLFPDNLKEIGGQAFDDCKASFGKLGLPSKLESLGGQAFRNAGSFHGDLVIPDMVTEIPESAFEGSRFSGGLNLGNIHVIGQKAFCNCGIGGVLIIPEGVTEIPFMSFLATQFSEIHLPSTITVIGEYAFGYNYPLTGSIDFPEGLLSIHGYAFSGCSRILSVSLPSSLQTIGSNAFDGCYNISSIVCDAVDPPSIASDAFNGVPKDSFTVGVPAQSVKRYLADPGWSDFKRIAAHYDFSMNRQYMRALNGAQSRTYTLRAPANFSWSVDVTSLPEWITVSPMAGTGKTDVTISVTEMSHTNDTFEVNEGTFNNPSYRDYNGRNCEVTFTLDEKDYSFTFGVEQYDCEYSDGYVQTLHTATHGPGIDIVFIGDGYDVRDIANGIFVANASEGYSYLFDLEPYKTYKDYFNVYAVTAVSDDSGIGTVNTVKDSKFGTRFTQNRILCEQPDAAFAWAKKADASMDLSKSLVILLMNASTYEGVTYMYGDGSALSCCPISSDAYPYDFRGIIQHEAGGHGFGKLADEYIYHDAYIQNCDCRDDCDHPNGDNDMSSSYGVFKSLGWYKNLSMSGDARQVPWAHLIYNPQYSDYVDMFEGGYMHSRGIYRSEVTSCMNNNIPYFSAISRQAIVERIKAYAGETFTLSDFYANDDDSFGTITKAGAAYPIDRTFGVDPLFHLGTDAGPVYMGDHPNVN